MGVLEELKESQTAEAALYLKLKQPGLSESERASIMADITAHSSARIAAYSQAAKQYTAMRGSTSEVTQATAAQLDALKLVEAQLNATKNGLQDKRNEALKMVEITAYTGLQYRAYARILAYAAGFAVLYVAALMLVRKFAARFAVLAWLPRAVLLGGSIYLIMQGFDLLLRRNDVFDEYAWPAAPRSADELDKANAKSDLGIKGNLPLACVGPYCCGDGTEWVDSKGCQVSASPSKPKTSALDGQALTTLGQSLTGTRA